MWATLSITCLAQGGELEKAREFSVRVSKASEEHQLCLAASTRMASVKLSFSAAAAGSSSEPVQRGQQQERPGSAAAVCQEGGAKAEVCGRQHWWQQGVPAAPAGSQCAKTAAPTATEAAGTYGPPGSAAASRCLRLLSSSSHMNKPGLWSFDVPAGFLQSSLTLWIQRLVHGTRLSTCRPRRQARRMWTQLH